MGAIPPDEKQQEEVWDFFSCDPIHRKVWVSFHLHASYLTDIGNIKNSEIKSEKDYLKHFKNKFRMAVGKFILIDKLCGFKYPVNVVSGPSHPHSLYWGLHILSAMVSSVVSKGRDKVPETGNMQIKFLHVLQKLPVQPVISRAKVWWLMLEVKFETETNPGSCGEENVLRKFVLFNPST